MTDKEQIIVDNVDVSECKYHRKCILPDNIGCKIDDFLCCDKPNCYFKQNARKQQVLDEIYLIIDEIKEQYDIWEISELEQIQDIINKAKDGE